MCINFIGDFSNRLNFLSFSIIFQKFAIGICVPFNYLFLFCILFVQEAQSIRFILSLLDEKENHFSLFYRHFPLKEELLKLFYVFLYFSLLRALKMFKELKCTKAFQLLF